MCGLLNIGTLRAFPIGGIVLIGVLISGCDNDESLLDTYPFPEEPVFFEHLPVDLAGVTSFVAMGEVNVLPNDHGGFFLKSFALPATVPVVAVRAGVIILSGRGTHTVNNPSSPHHGKTYDDYQLRLKISENVIVNYGHVSAINFGVLPELANLVADEMAHNVEVVVQSGDILGWIGPHPAIDFSVADHSLTLNFLNPSRYPGDHIYAADIYSYLKTPLLEKMVAAPPGMRFRWAAK